MTRVAIEAHPGEAPEAWLVRALVLDASGDPAEAIESYRRASELDPAGHGSWAYLVRLSRGLGDPGLLPLAVRRAATLEPEGGGEQLAQRILAMPQVIPEP